MAPTMDWWYKTVAPGNELKKRFDHDPVKWYEFRRRYFAELDNNRAACSPLAGLARSSDVAVLYSAKDKRRSSAEALLDYLRQNSRGSSQWLVTSSKGRSVRHGNSHAALDILQDKGVNMDEAR